MFVIFYLFFFLFCRLIPGKCKQIDALANVAVSKNTNGIGYWPTIPITIAKEFSWIGFCFLHAVCVAAIRYNHRTLNENIFQCNFNENLIKLLYHIYFQRSIANFFCLPRLKIRNLFIEA